MPSSSHSPSACHSAPTPSPPPPPLQPPRGLYGNPRDLRVTIIKVGMFIAESCSNTLWDLYTDPLASIGIRQLIGQRARDEQVAFQGYLEESM